MDNSPCGETTTMNMEEMAREIQSLKAALAKRATQAESADDIRSMLNDCFARITEAIKPSEIHGSIKDSVNEMSESISAHPIAAVSVALTAGFLIGRTVDRLSRCGKE